MAKDDIKKISFEIKDKLVEIRREIHKNPEISLKEFNTSKLISDVLKNEGLDVEDDFYKTAVLVNIKGGQEGKTILLRADIDALPVCEETCVSYKSNNKGVMHACGHDAHISWIIGATIILNMIKDKIKGNIKVIFQPSEEAPGGADSLLKTRNIINEYPKVDYAIAGHVWPEIESGKIGIVNGCAMAATSFFEININGKGGHAASPHKTVDPISIGNLIYTSIQNIMSRTKDPTEQGVISIGSFKGEGSYNIIPENANIKGTIRAESEEKAKEYSKKIEEITKGICNAFGAKADVNLIRMAPPVINDESLVSIGLKSYKDLYGENNALYLNKGSMTGEDFSFYLENTPGLFVYVGSRSKDDREFYPLHNSKFNIDEDILYKTSAYFANLAIDILNY